MTHTLIPMSPHGEDPAELAGVGHALSGTRVTGLALAHGGLEDLTALVNYLKERAVRPRYILMPHGGGFRDLAPRLAQTLGGEYIAGATALDLENPDGPVWHRPVYQNQRVEKIQPHPDLVQVVTLSPGHFAPEGHLSFPVHSLPPANHDNYPLVQLSTREGGLGDADLLAARVVVAVGRGIGDRENLDLARAMVQAIPNAALAASRPLVDAGWLPHGQQVGITGARVAPELYLALGISGSSQHLAGMAGSRTIVAVNHSPAAPIFRHADIRIHGDVVEFIQAFLDGTADISLKLP